LHISFTLRSDNTLIRVISERDMHRKERMIYEQQKESPEFKTEAEERAFWEQHDSSDYVNWDSSRSVSMPNLKPSTKTISLRLPESLLNSIKTEANRRDVPYQSLIKA
jgi:predicted DNA binding CopG/RHH family protein